MAQIIKCFTQNLYGKADVHGKPETVEEQINQYLTDNPTHYAKAISAYLVGQTKEAYVIFDIREDRGGKKQSGSRDQ